MDLLRRPTGDSVIMEGVDWRALIEERLTQAEAQGNALRLAIEQLRDARQLTFADDELDPRLALVWPAPPLRRADRWPHGEIRAPLEIGRGSMGSHWWKLDGREGERSWDGVSGSGRSASGAA